MSAADMSTTLTGVFQITTEPTGSQIYSLAGSDGNLYDLSFDMSAFPTNIADQTTVSIIGLVTVPSAAEGYYGDVEVTGIAPVTVTPTATTPMTTVPPMITPTQPATTFTLDPNSLELLLGIIGTISIVGLVTIASLKKKRN